MKQNRNFALKALTIALLTIGFNSAFAATSHSKENQNHAKIATVEKKETTENVAQEMKKEVVETQQMVQEKAQEQTTSKGILDNVKEVFKDIENGKIYEQLKTMNLTPEQVKITPTKLTALKEVVVSDTGDKMYINTDANMVIFGKLYDIKNTKFVDPAFAKLENYADTMIVNKAKDEKYVVTAFVDITCHYCHLLNQQIKEYNDLGITVRYLAFPREGLNGNVAKQMEAIFTSNDKVKVYNDAENGKLPTDLKEPNIVKQHYLLGLDFGIQGTPALILPNGQIIPGYLKAEQLLKALQENENK